MNFERALREFALHLGAERNLSPHTRRAYLSDLRQFVRFLGAGIAPGDVTALQVRSYLAELHASRHPATLGRKLAAVRCFYRYLVAEGACGVDPTTGIPMPRRPRRLPNPLPVDDCVTLMEAPTPAERGRAAPEAPTLMALRDRALVELLYGAGLRVGELAALDVRDVDLYRGDVRVRGKGGKERVVPLPAVARAGSVKPANAAEIFQIADVDGGLIGGASLKAKDFWGIIKAYGAE